jgi:hypothetical protein
VRPRFRRTEVPLGAEQGSGQAIRHDESHNAISDHNFHTPRRAAGPPTRWQHELGHHPFPVNDWQRCELCPKRSFPTRPELRLDERHDQQRPADHDDPVIGVHLSATKRFCVHVSPSSLPHEAAELIEATASERAHSSARFICAITATVPSSTRTAQHRAVAVNFPQLWRPSDHSATPAGEEVLVAAHEWRRWADVG